MSPTCRYAASGVARAGDRFAIMGFHSASDGSIHAAAFEDRLVVRIAPDGARCVSARSEAPWQPSACSRHRTGSG